MLCAVGDLVEDVVVWLSGAAGRRHRRRRPGLSPSRRKRGERRCALRLERHRRPASSARWEPTTLGERLTGSTRAAGVDVRIERGATGSRTGTSSCSSLPTASARCSPTGAPPSTWPSMDDRMARRRHVLHLPSYSLTAGCLARDCDRARGVEPKARQALLSVDASSIADARGVRPRRGYLDLSPTSSPPCS